jgi:tetratricopeptide (TPR) repeat protein
MTLTSIRTGIRILAIFLAAGLSFVPSSRAQDQQQPPPAKPAAPGQAAPAPGTPPPAEAPKIDPEEEKAFKAFADATAPQDTDKQIALGEQFVQKYPQSKYASAVYDRLTQNYLAKQETDKMYAAADKALAINKDDVTVLVIVGWTIPHVYDPNDLNSERLLNKAEDYEKHALQVLDTLPKPANLTDDQFAKAKQSALSQAHSGLGLVYFRRQDFVNSVNELELGEKLAATPDPTDFYVMGIELNQLKRYPEAVDAFQKCAQSPGGLADRCKQNAEQAKKAAAAAPASAPAKP